MRLDIYSRVHVWQDMYSRVRQEIHTKVWREIYTRVRQDIFPDPIFTFWRHPIPFQVVGTVCGLMV